MKVTFGPEAGSVIESFVDSFPGMIKSFGQESVASSLQARYEQNKKEMLDRYSTMPNLLLWNQGGNFLELFLEARTNYVEGKYWSTIALCGMVVESLCRDIARLRTDEPEFVKIINDKFIHQVINCLKDNRCFWLPATAGLMHSIMNVRNDYVHVKKTKIDRKEVLDILVKTSLVVIAEFGLMSGSRGHVVRINQDYFDRSVKSLGITIL